jgi:hypothetical protein
MRNGLSATFIPKPPKSHIRENEARRLISQLDYGITISIVGGSQELFFDRRLLNAQGIKLFKKEKIA